MDGMLQLSVAEERIRERARLAAATEARSALLATPPDRRRRWQRAWSWLAGAWAMWHHR